jgi:hypothetical protein
MFHFIYKKRPRIAPEAFLSSFFIIYAIRLSASCRGSKNKSLHKIAEIASRYIFSIDEAKVVKKI